MGGDVGAAGLADARKTRDGVLLLGLLRVAYYQAAAPTV